MKNNQKIAAIIVAAGEGRRMGAFDKVFGKLDGEAILLRATRPFQDFLQYIGR